MKSYDIIVLGGGRASNLAQRAAKAGKKVALIEADRLGGTCPNRGCVPSKLLIGHSDLLFSIRRAKEFWIDVHIEKIDREKIFSDNSNWIEKVDARYEGRFKDILDIYRGEGRFVSDKVVSVAGEELTADTIVIGTGTRAARPPKELGEELPIWTSEEIFPLESSNFNSIVVVGGGIIATELGAFFHSIGVETTVLVRGDKLLKDEDVDVQRVFQEEFSSHIPTRTNTSIKSVRYENGIFELELVTKGGETSTLQADRVLYATGRKPNSDNIGIENTGLQKTERGFIVVDEFLRTSVEGVYALGDVAGNYMFQHSASFEARYLGDCLLEGNSAPIDYGEMPHAVYSEPEVASVGATEQQLKASGVKYLAVFENFKASARALGMKIEAAGVKLIFSPEGKILGCHIVGPQSSTLIHQVLAVMNLGGSVYDIEKMIHIHPALSEVVLNAAEKAISLLKNQLSQS